MTYQLTPYGEPANRTDEGKAILAMITAAELAAANITSRVLYGGRDVDALDLSRLRTMWRGIQIERREKEQRGTPGTCWQCGTPTGGTSVECRPCHEGMTPAQYGRAMSKVFMTKPNALPSWMR
jgi:hypothetical protein